MIQHPNSVPVLPGWLYFWSLVYRKQREQGANPTQAGIIATKVLARETKRELLKQAQKGQA